MQETKLLDETVSQVITRIRGDLKPAEFAAELNVGRQWVYNWETGKQQPSDATLQSWWADERQWVRDLARDVLAAKFHGIAEAFLAELSSSKTNGKTK